MTMKQSQYQAYRMAHHTVAPTRQVVMLYEGAIRYMQQAKEAIGRNDISQRYNLLAKTGEIIMGLQNSIDFENGKDIARILYDFYARVDMEILSIHQSSSLEMCDHVIRQLKQMRDAWNHVDQTHMTHKPAPMPDAAAAAAVAAVAIPAAMEALANVALSV
jgi:flagellar protein FliS